MADKETEIVEDVGNDNFRESDNDNVMDNLNILDDEIVGEGSMVVPEVGMKFKSKNEMFDFYKSYAYNVGFPIRKRNSKKDDDGIMRYITLTCSREGRRPNNASDPLKPQPTIQTGCKARLTASSDMCGIWRINTVYLEHNHKTSPSKSRLYRCNRELRAHVKRRLEVNDMAGISLHKSFNAAVVEAGGYDNMTCLEKDARNYVEQVRRLKLGEGDAAAIQSYFSNTQAKCPGFYFVMDLDEESRLKNIFWADSRCRRAYKEFDDVVTFDTTYLTNKYDMPFATFVGVNHHGQSTLLGCGLLSNENTETFVWLFKTWLQCMDGEAPHGIITDQYRAMQNAIAIVFPNTKHRWCLWHIMKKLPEKFGNYADKRFIFAAIHRLVYDSQTVEEFEDGWSVMLETYNLHDNEWLRGLYEHRGRWVPCYLKTTFWAGMSTTQRSESMNAFFDDYVHSKTSLKQFVEQYERALRNKVEKEFQANFKSYSQMLPCATTYEIEKQYQAVYTISKFRELQEEFVGKVYCDHISSSEGPFGTLYEVREDVVCLERWQRKIVFVTFKSDNHEISCSCHLFEFRGILCRHAISVMIRNNVRHVPKQYILRRWRRDVRRAHTRVAVNYDGLSSTPGQLNYDKIIQVCSTLADMVADNDEQTRELIEWIEEKKQKVTTVKETCDSNVLSQHSVRLGSGCGTSDSTGSENIRDPPCLRRKGAPKKLCRKSPLELSSRTSKAQSTSNKGKRPQARRSNLGNIAASEVPTTVQPQYHIPPPLPYSNFPLVNDGRHMFAQPWEYPHLFQPSATNAGNVSNVLNMMPNFYHPFSDHDSTNNVQISSGEEEHLQLCSRVEQFRGSQTGHQ